MHWNVSGPQNVAFHPKHNSITIDIEMSLIYDCPPQDGFRPGEPLAGAGHPRGHPLSLLRGQNVLQVLGMAEEGHRLRDADAAVGQHSQRRHRQDATFLRTIPNEVSSRRHHSLSRSDNT